MAPHATANRAYAAELEARAAERVVIDVVREPRPAAVVLDARNNARLRRDHAAKLAAALSPAERIKLQAMFDLHHRRQT